MAVERLADPRASMFGSDDDVDHESFWGIGFRKLIKFTERHRTTSGLGYPSGIPAAGIPVFVVIPQILRCVRISGKDVVMNLADLRIIFRAKRPENEPWTWGGPPFHGGTSVRIENSFCALAPSVSCDNQVPER